MISVLTETDKNNMLFERQTLQGAFDFLSSTYAAVNLHSCPDLVTRIAYKCHHALAPKDREVYVRPCLPPKTICTSICKLTDCDLSFFSLTILDSFYHFQNTLFSHSFTYKNPLFPRPTNHNMSTHAAIVTVSPRSPLQVLQLPTPVPTANEVLIRNLWTASTPLDLHQADGGLLVTHPQVLGDGTAG